MFPFSFFPFLRPSLSLSLSRSFFLPLLSLSLGSWKKLTIRFLVDAALCLSRFARSLMARVILCGRRIDDIKEIPEQKNHEVRGECVNVGHSSTMNVSQVIGYRLFNDATTNHPLLSLSPHPLSLSLTFCMQKKCKEV